MKFSIFKINSYLDNTNIQCVDKYYRNLNMRMSFKCQNGHEFKASWERLRKYLVNSANCPICDGNSNFISKNTPKEISKEPSEITRRQYARRRKQERMLSDPHEIAIQSLLSKIPHSKQYKFRQSVKEMLVEYEAMAELGIPGDSIKKELKNDYCYCFISGTHWQASDETWDGCDNCDIDECEKKTAPLKNLLFDGGHIEDIVSEICFVPDLYSINKEECEIVAIEVENTNRVSISKIFKYCQFADHLDYYLPEWTFKLLICDRFGNEMGFINWPVYYTAFEHISDRGLDDKKEWVECIRYVEEEVVPTAANDKQYYRPELERIENELMGYYRSAPYSSW